MANNYWANSTRAKWFPTPPCKGWKLGTRLFSADYSAAQSAWLISASVPRWRVARGSMLQAVVDSIFEGGVNNQLLAAVNIVFVSLVLVTLTMFLLVGFNVHLLVMLLLSSGLLLSVNWYVFVSSPSNSWLMNYSSILFDFDWTAKFEFCRFEWNLRLFSLSLFILPLLPRVIDFKFPCSLTKNITSYSKENLAFHSLPRWKMIILPVLKFLTYTFLCTFWTWE